MTQEKSSMRLNKFVALATGSSRREADDMIASKRVHINGQIAAIGAQAHPQDVITLDNKPLEHKVQYLYLLLNKPTGYVCSRKAQDDAPTIYSLVPEQYHSLKPVGRLDKDSSGVILLTNNGDLAQQMTHPSYHKIKIYQISLDHELEPLHQQMISDFGVTLEDGSSQFELMRLSETNRREWQITMSEGRNRQIRRTFAALGYTVKKLRRTHFGQYSLDNLPRGKYRFVAIDQ